MPDITIKLDGQFFYRRIKFESIISCENARYKCVQSQQCRKLFLKRDPLHICSCSCSVASISFYVKHLFWSSHHHHLSLPYTLFCSLPHASQRTIKLYTDGFEFLRLFGICWSAACLEEFPVVAVVVVQNCRTDVKAVALRQHANIFINFIRQQWIQVDNRTINFVVLELQPTAVFYGVFVCMCHASVSSVADNNATIITTSPSIAPQLCTCTDGINKLPSFTRTHRERHRHKTLTRNQI